MEREGPQRRRGGGGGWEKAPFSMLDYVHYAYFAVHIPISLFMDFQAILPMKYFPSAAQKLGDFYNNDFRDPLMSADPKPLWFKSFVWCEAALQMPFFGVALYAMHTAGSWIRIPGIIYGTHVATTVVPILAEVLLGDYGLSTKEKALLTSVYFPWLLIPLTYVWKLAFDPTPYRKIKRD